MQRERCLVVEGEGCSTAVSGVTTDAMILELDWETSVEVKGHGEVSEVRTRAICIGAIHFP